MAQNRVSAVKVTEREQEAIARIIKTKPMLWEGAADFIHEAIREKLRKEGGESA